MSPLAQLIVELAARPQGVAHDDIKLIDYTPGEIANAARWPVDSGLLTKVRANGKRLFFADKAQAAAVRDREALRRKNAEVKKFNSFKAQLIAPAEWREQEAIIPPHVKVQVCPPHRPMFESIDLPVYGGNQRGRVTR